MVPHSKNVKSSALLLLIAAVALLAVGLDPAHASKVAKGKVFSATVEDGTPKTLKAHTNVEDDVPEDLSLSDLAPEVSDAPESAKAQDQEVNQEAPAAATVKTEVTIPAPVAVAPAVASSAEHRGKAGFEDRLLQRFDDLEKALKDSGKSTVEAQSKPRSESRIVAEKVPGDKISELRERLKYTNYILTHYGLAYDYRMMTRSEFKKVLASLEAKSKKKNLSDN